VDEEESGWVITGGIGLAVAFDGWFLVGDGGRRSGAAAQLGVRAECALTG
jgi:hypothetical protein